MARHVTRPRIPCAHSTRGAESHPLHQPAVADAGLGVGALDAVGMPAARRTSTGLVGSYSRTQPAPSRCLGREANTILMTVMPTSLSGLLFGR